MKERDSAPFRANQTFCELQEAPDMCVPLNQQIRVIRAGVICATEDRRRLAWRVHATPVQWLCTGGTLCDRLANSDKTASSSTAELQQAWRASGVKLRCGASCSASGGGDLSAASHGDRDSEKVKATSHGDRDSEVAAVETRKEPLGQSPWSASGRVPGEPLFRLSR